MKNGAPKDIPALVRETAARWRESFLERHVGSDVSPLEKYVNEYMRGIFVGLLDELLGIDRAFGRVEFKTRNVQEGIGVAKELMDLARPQVLKAAKELVDTVRIKLSKVEREKLREDFRRALLREVENRLRELAVERAKAITVHELDRFMSDDEWVSVVEGRVVEGAVG